MTNGLTFTNIRFDHDEKSDLHVYEGRFRQLKVVAECVENGGEVFYQAVISPELFDKLMGDPETVAIVLHKALRHFQQLDPSGPKRYGRQS